MDAALDTWLCPYAEWQTYLREQRRAAGRGTRLTALAIGLISGAIVFYVIYQDDSLPLALIMGLLTFTLGYVFQWFTGTRFIRRRFGLLERYREAQIRFYPVHIELTDEVIPLKDARNFRIRTDYACPVIEFTLRLVVAGRGDYETFTVPIPRGKMEAAEGLVETYGKRK